MVPAFTRDVTADEVREAIRQVDEIINNALPPGRGSADLSMSNLSARRGQVIGAESMSVKQRSVADSGAIGDSVLISVCLGVVFQMCIVAIDGALLFLVAQLLQERGLLLFCELRFHDRDSTLIDVVKNADRLSEPQNPYTRDREEHVSRRERTDRQVGVQRDGCEPNHQRYGVDRDRAQNALPKGSGSSLSMLALINCQIIELLERGQSVECDYPSRS